MGVAVLGSGIYTYSEAARLVGVKPQRLSTWFVGGRSRRGPALQGTYAGSAGLERTISFLDLIEALVASKLRCKGVSLIVIRKAHAQLTKILGTPSPFAHARLCTDGKQVFVHLAEQSKDEALIDAVTRQHVFPKVILPYVERIDYSEDTELAERWRVGKGIVIDPRLRLGKPIVEDAGMPTSVLASAFRANCCDAELVADWYGVSPKAVEMAVAFEERMSRKVA